MPAYLLKIGELADTSMPSHQTSQPSPHAPKRRAFPVVLHKAEVVHLHIHADGAQAIRGTAPADRAGSV